MNFPECAYVLFNKKCLSFESNKFRLLEIEFYFCCESHPDPYVHCNSEQLNHDTLYFHSGKYPGSYKGGTFKGVDLTFGNSDCYCGILLRSMQNIETGEVIEGPCNFVNRMLLEFGAGSIAELVNFWGDIQSSRIIHDHDFELTDIYCGPRIGLKGDSPWKDLPYRFVIFPNLIKK